MTIKLVIYNILGVILVNILIIGNGFDKAHSLPTGYDDFLNALKPNTEFHKFMNRVGGKNLKSLNNLISGKLFKYLSQNRERRGWINFEVEMKVIIDSICEFPLQLNRYSDLNSKEIKYEMRKDELTKLPPFILMLLSQKNSFRLKWNEKQLDDMTLDVHNQISNFIGIFKEYIVWVSQNKMEHLKSIEFFEKLEIDRFLSFNYTNTYLKLYKPSEGFEKGKVCYVHGNIRSNNKTKIVMGVGSDYFDQDKHEDFIDFFKFFQRYKYLSDNRYLQWFQDIIDEDEKNKTLQNSKLKIERILSSSHKHHVHIYGHSLDPTDGDILKPFLNIENAEISIYYLDEDTKLKLEKNILKILGKDFFSLFLTGGSKAKIKLIHI